MKYQFWDQVFRLFSSQLSPRTRLDKLHSEIAFPWDFPEASIKLRWWSSPRPALGCTDDAESMSTIGWPLWRGSISLLYQGRREIWLDEEFFRWCRGVASINSKTKNRERLWQRFLAGIRSGRRSISVFCIHSRFWEDCVSCSGSCHSSICRNGVIVCHTNNQQNRVVAFFFSSVQLNVIQVESAWTPLSAINLADVEVVRRIFEYALDYI